MPKKYGHENQFCLPFPGRRAHPSLRHIWFYKTHRRKLFVELIPNYVQKIIKFQIIFARPGKKNLKKLISQISETLKRKNLKIFSSKLKKIIKYDFQNIKLRNFFYLYTGRLCFSRHNLGLIPQIAFFGGFCKTCYALRRGVRGKGKEPCRTFI